MLDEDESPVECIECIQRTCLQASALTETTRIVPANEESVLRVGDTNTPQDRRAGREKFGKEGGRGRTTGRRAGGMGKLRETERRRRAGPLEIQEKFTTFFVPRR